MSQHINQFMLTCQLLLRNKRPQLPPTNEQAVLYASVNEQVISPLLSVSLSSSLPSLYTYHISHLLLLLLQVQSKAPPLYRPSG